MGETEEYFDLYIFQVVKDKEVSDKPTINGIILELSWR